MNKNISMAIESKLIEQFEQTYGKKILRLFIRRAIMLAVSDKKIFDFIFFSDVNSEVNNG